MANVTQYKFNIHTTQFEIQTYPKTEGYNSIIVDELATNKIVDKSPTLITLTGDDIEPNEALEYPKYKFGDIGDVTLRGYCVQHINSNPDTPSALPTLSLSVDGSAISVTFNTTQTDASVGWEVVIPKADMPAGAHDYVITSDNASELASATINIDIDRDPANINTPTTTFPTNSFDGSDYVQTYLRTDQKFAGTSDAVFAVSTDVTAEHVKIKAVDTTDTTTYVDYVLLDNVSGNDWKTSDTNVLPLSAVSPDSFKIKVESSKRVIGQTSTDGGTTWTPNNIDIDKNSYLLSDTILMDSVSPIVTLDTFSASTSGHEAVRFDTSGDHDNFTFRVVNPQVAPHNERASRFKVEPASIINWACDATGDHSGSSTTTLTATMSSNNLVEQFDTTNLRVIPFKSTNGTTGNAATIKIPVDNNGITVTTPEVKNASNAYVSVTNSKHLPEGSYDLRVQTDDKLKELPVVTISDGTNTQTPTVTEVSNTLTGSEHACSFTLDASTTESNITITSSYTNISGAQITDTSYLGKVLRITDVSTILPTRTNPVTQASIQQTHLKGSDQFEVEATLNHDISGDSPVLKVLNPNNHFTTEPDISSYSGGIYSDTVTMASHNANNLSLTDSFSFDVELTEPYFGFSVTRAVDGGNLNYTNVYPELTNAHVINRGDSRESLGYDDGTVNGVHDEWSLDCINHTHIKMEDPQGYLSVHENTTIDNNSFKKVYMSSNDAIEKNLSSNTEINMRATAFKEENGAQLTSNYYFPVDNTTPTLVVDIKLAGETEYVTFVNNMALPVGVHTLKISGDDRFKDASVPYIQYQINSGAATTLTGWNQIENTFDGGGYYEFTADLPDMTGMSTLSLDITSYNSSNLTTNTVLNATGEFDSISFGLPITDGFNNANHQTTKARSVVDGSGHRTRFKSSNTNPATEYGYIEVQTDLSASAVEVQEKNQSSTKVALTLGNTTASTKYWYADTNTFEVRNGATDFYLTYFVTRDYSGGTQITIEADSSNQIPVDNTEPTLTSPQISYPASQTSLDTGESATVVFTNTNADSYLCTPNSGEGWTLNAVGNSSNPITGSNATVVLDWNWTSGDTEEQNLSGDIIKSADIQPARLENGWIGENSSNPPYVKADKTAAGTISFQIKVDQTGSVYQPTSINGIPPGTHSIHLASDDVIQDPGSNLSSATSGVTLGTSWTSSSGGQVWSTTIVIDAGTTGTFNISGNIYNTSNISTSIDMDFTIDYIVSSTATFPSNTDPVGGGTHIQTRLKNTDIFDAINITMSTTGFTSVIMDGIALEQDSNNNAIWKQISGSEWEMDNTASGTTFKIPIMANNSTTGATIWGYIETAVRGTGSTTTPGGYEFLADQESTGWVDNGVTYTDNTAGTSAIRYLADNSNYATWDLEVTGMDDDGNNINTSIRYQNLSGTHFSIPNSSTYEQLKKYYLLNSAAGETTGTNNTTTRTYKRTNGKLASIQKSIDYDATLVGLLTEINNSSTTSDSFIPGKYSIEVTPNDTLIGTPTMVLTAPAGLSITNEDGSLTDGTLTWDASSLSFKGHVINNPGSLGSSSYVGKTFIISSHNIINTAGAGVLSPTLTSRDFRDFKKPSITYNTPTTGYHYGVGSSTWDDTNWDGEISDGSIEKDGVDDFVGADNFVSGTRQITEVAMDESYDGSTFNSDDTTPDIVPADPFNDDPEWQFEISNNVSGYSSLYATRVKMTYTPNGGLSNHSYYSNVVSQTLNWVGHVSPVDGQTLSLPNFDNNSNYIETNSCEGRDLLIEIPNPGCGHGSSFTYQSTNDNGATWTDHYTGDETSRTINFPYSSSEYKVRVQMSNAEFTGLTSAETAFYIVGKTPSVTIDSGPAEALADGSTQYTFTASHDSNSCTVTSWTWSINGGNWTVVSGGSTDTLTVTFDVGQSTSPTVQVNAAFSNDTTDTSLGYSVDLIPALTYNAATINKTEFFYYDMENTEGDLAADGPGIVPSVEVLTGKDISVTFNFGDWSEGQHTVTENDAGQSGLPGTYSYKKWFPRAIQTWAPPTSKSGNVDITITSDDIGGATQTATIASPTITWYRYVKNSGTNSQAIPAGVSSPWTNATFNSGDFYGSHQTTGFYRKEAIKQITDNYGNATEDFQIDPSDGKQIGIGYPQNNAFATPPGNALVQATLDNNLGVETIDCKEPFIDT